MQPSDRINQPPRAAFLYALAVLLAWLVLYAITSPNESGDTTRYANDALEHAQGIPSQFWEFGHLLWRPWGYIGLYIAGPLFRTYFHDTDLLAIIRFFVWTNFVCCSLAILLVWDIVRRRTSLWLASLVAVAFACANCFITLAGAGSAYLPALFFECLSLWLIVQGLERSTSTRFLAAAGLSYGIAISLWFPYAFTGLGVLAFVLFWPASSVAAEPSRSQWKARLPLAGVLLIALILFTGAGFTAGAMLYGAHNAAGLKQWVLAADNGWSQGRNLVRAATGIPRFLFDLGWDTIVLKRWFFKDPYNTVHLRGLTQSLLLKLVLFYGGAAGLLWILVRERAARAALLILLAAAVPLLLFAIFIFEPSSAERYVPVLPFFSIALAVAWQLGSRHKIALIATAVMLASAAVLNVTVLAQGNNSALTKVRQRRESLERAMTRPGIVFVTTLRDDFYFVPLLRPLDRSIAPDRYRTIDIVELASVRANTWRKEFADRTLNAWHDGLDVWVSERVLAARPSADWLWVEGDDPRVHWADFPGFFGRLQHDPIAASGGDGFFRVSATPANSAILQSIAASAAMAPVHARESVKLQCVRRSSSEQARRALLPRSNCSNAPISPPSSSKLRPI